MLISIVVLTWNSIKHLSNCIESIYNSGICGQFEIILVDNGSKDGSLELIKSKFNDVFVIQNKENRGIAPARNQGIKQALGKYILILDIDTKVYVNSINTLVSYMEENKDVGLCGPKLVFEDGTVQKSCRKFPVLQGKLLRRINTNWAKKILEKENYSQELSMNKNFEVDYLIGACQLIRKSALERIGILDENIFYGPEDVDLCLRMWQNGLKVIYIPEAIVIHFEQRITKKKIMSYIMLRHIQGLIYYFFKHKYFFRRERVYKTIKGMLL